MTEDQSSSAVERALLIIKESGQETERQVPLILEAKAALAIAVCSATAEREHDDHKEGVFSVLADKLLLALRTQDLSKGHVSVSMSYRELATVVGFLLEDDPSLQWLIPVCSIEISGALESFVGYGGIDPEGLLPMVTELAARKGLGS